MTEKEFTKKYCDSFRAEGRLKNIGEAKKRIDFFFETLEEALAKERKVIFKDWGKFEIENREERVYGNPKTQERIVIPAKKVFKFTVGKEFANKIKNS